MNWFRKKSKYISRDEVVHITIGYFSSYSHDTSVVFRYAGNDFEIDTSDKYWSDRFTETGYLFFPGESLFLPQVREQAEQLLKEVPDALLSTRLPRPDAPGSKDESTTFIAIHFADSGALHFAVNDLEAIRLSSEIRLFLEKVRHLISRLTTSYLEAVRNS